MRTIYKYTLDITDRQRIETRKEAGTTSQIVHVGLDPNGIPCIWVEMTPGDYVESLEIAIIGTGNPIHGTYKHIGSFVDRSFVWHVYV